MMKGKFRLCDYEVGETLYRHIAGQWQKYGVIEEKEKNCLYIRSDKHLGIMIIREDILVKEGYISQINT
tara:strand:+ start:123 stop:329 length:207 start_codon:yes stop_codon:yes gene_type:complete